MRTWRKHRGGFTIVEMLVVIGITALLLTVIVPALSGARKRVRKAEELNHLRQIGVAWTMYANQSNDAVLPGYLSTEAQRAWKVRYRFADGRPILPAPDFEAEEDNVAGPWVWRLMPYLDHNPDVVMGHRHESIDAARVKEHAGEMRDTPAFGYNGLFFGGWWVGPRTTWFEQATVAGSNRRVQVVSRALGSIRRSSEVLIFGSSAERMPGIYRYQAARDDPDGAFMVQPPILGKRKLWGETKVRAEAEGGPGTSFVAQVGGDPFSIEYYGDDGWPDGSTPFG